MTSIEIGRKNEAKRNLPKVRRAIRQQISWVRHMRNQGSSVGTGKLLTMIADYRTAQQVAR